jgi:hypothetical protein
MPRIASNKCRGRILRSVWNLWPLAERWHLGIYYEQRCWEPSTTLTLQGWRRGRAPVNRTAGCLLMKEAGNILQYEQRCWELATTLTLQVWRRGRAPVNGTARCLLMKQAGLPKSTRIRTSVSSRKACNRITPTLAEELVIECMEMEYITSDSICWVVR